MRDVWTLKYGLVCGVTDFTKGIFQLEKVIVSFKKSVLTGFQTMYFLTPSK